MSDHKPKLLLIEVWGLGDLVITTGFLRRAVEHFEVTLLAKPYAAALLGRDFPEVRFVAWDPPWTAFRGKYRLWRWPWRQIAGVLRGLRRERFAAAVSVRPDPRDHLVMWLAGVRARYGFPRRGSGVVLNHPLPRRIAAQHRAEDWQQIGTALGLPRMAEQEPALQRPPPEPAASGEPSRPEVCFHLGARIAVRRWPETYYRDLITRLRAEADFHLTLISDPDGYGANLADLADTYLPKLDLPTLVATLGRARVLICNDSAPAHIAAAQGVPVVAFFGPTDPVAFRPWGAEHLVVIRDLCAYRPCFDYCKFPEPYCLTRLTPDVVWPEIREYVQRHLGARASPEASEVPLRSVSTVSAGPATPAARSVGPLRLALSMLCENPLHKTGLTTFFHEFVSRSLTLFDDLEWIVFAGPKQEWTISSPRMQVVRRYPAHHRLGRRLLAAHLRVPADARQRGADALLTVGFVPVL